MIDLIRAIAAGDAFMIFAQGVGFLALLVSALSYQTKTQRTIMIMQTFSTALFAVHMGLIGAAAGMLLNAFGTFRCLVFSFRNKYKWAASPIWIGFFLLLFAAATALSVFGARAVETTLGLSGGTLSLFLPADGEGVIALLPFTGMILSTFAAYSKSASRVRLLTLINSPFWLLYNALIPTPSVAGILTEITLETSIVIGMLRLDRKKKTAENG